MPDTAQVEALTAERVTNLQDGEYLVYEAGAGQSNHVKAEVDALPGGVRNVCIEVKKVLKIGPDAVVMVGDRFPAEFSELRIELI